MSNITDLTKWRELKKQAEEDINRLYDDMDDVWEEEVTVHHTLVTDDRDDDEFIELRNLLDAMGASYTVRSTPPEI
tara:strand:- start:135 stop:362 length:228 start_codon:yes stop_codon:yes gene_type:complete